MKRFFVIITAFLLLGFIASAQPRAIGLRGTYGAEISYQHNLGANFVEADLGFMANNGFYLTGVYDFILLQHDILNFYAGPGLQLGVYSNRNDKDNTGFNAAILGQAGVEVVIPSAPINISLDWRPAINLAHGGFGWQGFGLALRYRF